MTIRNTASVIERFIMLLRHKSRSDSTAGVLSLITSAMLSDVKHQ